MEQHDFLQGSPDWHQHRATHFNASDAPAMLGISQYKTRNQLLREMATGITPEIDAATQRRFDDGHRFEALARPLAEQIIGKKLYPVIGSEGKLSASFDGLAADDSVAFEHKTLNDNIRAAIAAGTIPAEYCAQMEQQLMISGATKCLFMASKWENSEEITAHFIECADGTRQYYRLMEYLHCRYESNQDMRNNLMQGWTQFAIDLENYQHVEQITAAVAAPTRDLPALSIQVQGSISLIDNLSVFGAQLKTFVAEINMAPTDDQGFADAEAAVKTLQAAQDALEAAEASALAQTSSIDEMRRTVKLYADTARTTRLMLEKMVKARKESIRIEIVQGGKDALAERVATLNKRLVKVQLPPIPADFAGVIKGKKTIASLREAVNNEVLRAEREANALADKIEINLNSLLELAKDHAFLFADTPHLVMKANDDLVALIKVRITEHQQAEAEKLEAEREAMRIEEEAKAKAKIEAEVAARAKSEAEALTLGDVMHAAAPVSIAQAIAPRRPNRVELLDAVATTFGTTNEAALDWILQEFRGDIQHEARKAA